MWKYQIIIHGNGMVFTLYVAYISIKRATTTVLFLLMHLQRKDCIENR